MQKFEDVSLSTKTIVIDTNIEVNITHIFNTFPVHELPDCPSPASKKKFRAFIAEQHLPDGTIIALECDGAVRGIPIKHFRNAMTIVMVLEDKYINFKLPPKGRIQITGCKFDRYAEGCVRFLWAFLKQYSTSDTPLYTFRGVDTTFKAIFHVVMSNRNFNLGFVVNRQKLDEYVNTQDEFPGTSLLELTFGYTGLNIKLPYNRQNSLLTTLEETVEGEWVSGTLEYNEYLKLLSPKEYARESVKSRHNSFFIFRSGSAIMSGLDAQHMEVDYYRFMRMIDKCKLTIEDTILR